MRVHPRSLAAAGVASALVSIAAGIACGDATGKGSAAERGTAPGHAPKAEGAPPKPEKPAAPAKKEKEPVFKRTMPMMGTVISVTVVGEPDDKVAPAVDAALKEMQRLETVLSEWLPDSEVSRINAAAGKHAVKVGPDTLAVVRAGVEISRWSDGAFDLSWAALRGMYKFQPGEEVIPEPREIKKRLPLIDYRKIRIDEAASTVMLTRSGMAIGTGGIAKGYALDRASLILKEAGLHNFMWFGGGQVQVAGRREGRAWRVGIQHPRMPDYFAFLEAEGGSISTSGDYEHAFVRDGKRWHHIIDTDTGLPADKSSSVTVHADNGLYADALSTAIFVMGPPRALAKLPTAPGNPSVVIVDGDMRLHASPSAKLVMRTKLQDGKLPLAPETEAEEPAAPSAPTAQP